MSSSSSFHIKEALTSPNNPYFMKFQSLMRQANNAKKTKKKENVIQELIRNAYKALDQSIYAAEESGIHFLMSLYNQDAVNYFKSIDEDLSIYIRAFILQGEHYNQKSCHASDILKETIFSDEEIEFFLLERNYKYYDDRCFSFSKIDILTCYHAVYTGLKNTNHQDLALKYLYYYDEACSIPPLYWVPNSVNLLFLVHAYNQELQNLSDSHPSKKAFLEKKLFWENRYRGQLLYFKSTIENLRFSQNMPSHVVFFDNYNFDLKTNTQTFQIKISGTEKANEIFEEFYKPTLNQYLINLHSNNILPEVAGFEITAARKAPSENIFSVNIKYKNAIFHHQNLPLPVKQDAKLAMVSNNPARLMKATIIDDYFNGKAKQTAETLTAHPIPTYFTAKK